LKLKGKNLRHTQEIEAEVAKNPWQKIVKLWLFSVSASAPPSSPAPALGGLVPAWSPAPGVLREDAILLL